MAEKVHLTPRLIKEKSPNKGILRYLARRHLTSWGILVASLTLGPLFESQASPYSLKTPLNYASSGDSEALSVHPELQAALDTDWNVFAHALWGASSTTVSRSPGIYSETINQWHQASVLTSYALTPNLSFWAGIHRVFTPDTPEWRPSASCDLSQGPFSLRASVSSAITIASPQLFTRITYAWVLWSQVLYERSWNQSPNLSSLGMPNVLTQSPSAATSAFDRLAITAFWEPTRSWKVNAAVELARQFSQSARSTGISVGLEYRFGESKAEPLDVNTPILTRKNNSESPKITAVRDDVHLVKLNHGTQSGIAVGQKYNLYSPNVNTPLARVVVQSVHSDESVAHIEEYFRTEWIEEGFTAKPVLVSD